MTKFSSRIPEFAEGDALGPYRLERQLGEGGMAVVFLASRASDGASVALKLLKANLTADETFRHRFQHEVRSAAEVRHEHLVAILDSGELDGRPYIASAYVEGPTLEQRVRGAGPLPLADALRLVGEVTSGLEALHLAGLVHRDVKASNILLDASGRAMLADFGLARGAGYTLLTRPGQVLGTLEYLAPELIRGEPATVESDIYALGCTVYEAITGQTPFAGRGLFHVGMGHLEDEPPNPALLRPECGRALGSAIVLALAKDPRHRPLPASAYARALRSAAAAE